MPDIVQILTPPGVAAIAVVRLRGPRVADFEARHLSRATRTGACVHTQLHDAGAVIDDPVAVRVDEQTLDLSVHGGTWVVERVVALAHAAGFVTTADPIPESLEQEIEHALPRALTRETLAILLAQPDAWRDMLDRDDRAAMRKALQDRALQHLLHPPVVAIVGAPNVGKSTLANQLFGRERSITADLPGTTRDWVGEQATLSGLVITLVDTPGVRETTDDIERQAIAQSRQVVSRASLVIEVVDVTGPRERAFPDADLVVLNKCDRLADKAPAGVIGLSARTGEGVPSLVEAVLRHFGCDELRSAHARCWTERQRAILASRTDLATA